MRIFLSLLGTESICKRDGSAIILYFIFLCLQSGRGPRATPVQGLIPVGELLTAVVTVKGDTEFDLLVRNCVATDGTPENKMILTDKYVLEVALFD